MTITRRLAHLLSTSSASDIPPHVFHQAQRSVLNWLGAALGGCRDESVGHALAMLGEFSGPPQATVIGHARRLDALNAALVNGISSNIPTSTTATPASSCTRRRRSAARCLRFLK
jgi:2-methylcitrate dehydratase PrpD